MNSPASFCFFSTVKLDSAGTLTTTWLEVWVTPVPPGGVPVMVPSLVQLPTALSTCSHVNVVFAATAATRAAADAVQLPSVSPERLSETLPVLATVIW